MTDFTIKSYSELLNTLFAKHYNVISFIEFINDSNKRSACLRHDVDHLPHNALKMAKLEEAAGISSTYYFRAIPSIFKPDIIKKISDLGHEIGYHYENLSTAAIKMKNEEEYQKDLYETALDDFRKNLEKFRKLYPVKTICMHGSPLSKYDNRDLWKKYDYRDYGIIGEPYFDIDFDEVLYLTDTGRAWNTSWGNVRDKVKSKYNYNFKSTFDIIRALEKNELPDKIMLNVHPHRWHDTFVPWTKELVLQNIKNVVKGIFFRG